ncbi:hypothetical protein [Paenibacillus sp. A14]
MILTWYGLWGNSETDRRRKLYWTKVVDSSAIPCGGWIYKYRAMR